MLPCHTNWVISYICPHSHSSVQFSSVAQSCPTLCNPMNHSMAGLPVHHQLPEFTQTHVHRVSVMPSSHLILCRPLLLLPPIPPSIRVFSNESALRMRWSEYWSFSFSIIPSKEIPGLISFRIDWLDFLAVHGTLKSLLQHHSSINIKVMHIFLKAEFFLLHSNWQILDPHENLSSLNGKYLVRERLNIWPWDPDKKQVIHQEINSWPEKYPSPSTWLNLTAVCPVDLAFHGGHKEEAGRRRVGGTKWTAHPGSLKALASLERLIIYHWRSSRK